MVPQFAFNSPTRIQFGVGASTKVGQEARSLGLERVLLVVDKGIAKAGLLDRIIPCLEAAECHYEVFDKVVANPRVETVEDGATLYQKSLAHGLIALGGGSCIDAAKGIGVVANNGGSVDWYEYGHKKIANRIPPLIAIPTTAGTGSEVTSWAVITSVTRQDKMDIGDGSSASSPVLALVDPEMTLTLPPLATAATGMDALTHAIEGYTSWTANPMSDLLNLCAIELIARSLRQAVARGDTIEWRSQMLYASMLAGLGFSNSSCGLVHALAQKLGGIADVPHGVANAIFLPYVMEFNLLAAPEKYSVVAKTMGMPVAGLSPMGAAAAAVEAVHELVRDVGIPSLKDLGIEPGLFGRVAEGALTYLDAKGNARPATLDDNLHILRRTYNQDR